jgi:hypothetical protein
MNYRTCVNTPFPRHILVSLHTCTIPHSLLLWVPAIMSTCNASGSRQRWKSKPSELPAPSSQPFHSLFLDMQQSSVPAFQPYHLQHGCMIYSLLVTAHKAGTATTHNSQHTLEVRQQRTNFWTHDHIRTITVNTVTLDGSLGMIRTGSMYSFSEAMSDGASLLLRT